MKKTNWLCLLLLMAGINLGFTACNDDDDETMTPPEENYDDETMTPPEESYDYALQIVGDYTGTMNTKFYMGDSERDFGDAENQELAIRQDSLNYATIIYKNWTGMGVNYGNLVIGNVKVGKTGKTYTVEGAGTQTLYKEGRPFEAALTVSGTVAETSNLVITVDMPTPAPDFKLTFNGTRQVIEQP